MAYQDPMTGKWLIVRKHPDGRTEWLGLGYDVVGNPVWTEDKRLAREFHAESLARFEISRIEGGLPGVDLDVEAAA